MKTYDTMLSAPITRDMYERLSQLAEAGDRSLSGEVRRALRLYVQRVEAERQEEARV
jgi:predicted transcriptional regulator